MALEFKDILTSKGMRTGKVQGNTLVQDITRLIQERAIVSIPGPGLKPQEGLRQDQGLWPREADNANTPAARRRSEGGDGIPVSTAHGASGDQPLADFPCSFSIWR
jgi:hypothetical protein